MSSITQVGSYASYLNLVRNLSNGQQRVDQLSQQLTTGVKSVDLNGYGTETQSCWNCAPRWSSAPATSRPSTPQHPA